MSCSDGPAACVTRVSTYTQTPVTLPARPAAHRRRGRPGGWGRCAGAGWWRRAPLLASYARVGIAGLCSAGRGPTDIGRWVAQGVRGDRPCRGVRPGAPPGLRGREGHRVSWSSRPRRTRPARGRPRSPPPGGSSRAGSAWRRWRTAASPVAGLPFSARYERRQRAEARPSCFGPHPAGMPPQDRVLMPDHQQLSILRQVAAKTRTASRVPGT